MASECVARQTAALVRAMGVVTNLRTHTWLLAFIDVYTLCCRIGHQMKTAMTITNMARRRAMTYLTTATVVLCTWVCFCNKKMSSYFNNSRENDMQLNKELEITTQSISYIKFLVIPKITQTFEHRKIAYSIRDLCL